MPNDPNSDAAWSAAGQAISTAGNVIAQGKINKATRKWNEDRLREQRQWALDDWNMQNAYNSPAAQMARYKEAGLNPNLIYGQSNEAGVVRSSPSGQWNPQAPDYSGVGTVMDKYFNTAMKTATINNLQAQNDNLLAQRKLIDAQTAGIYKNMENLDSTMTTRQWQLGRDQGLFPGQMEMQDWSIRHSMKDLDIKTQQNEMSLLKGAQSLEQGAVDIFNSRLDSAIKMLDARYKEGLVNQQVYDKELKRLETIQKIGQERLTEYLRNKISTDAALGGDEGIWKTIDGFIKTFGIVK